MLINHNLDPGYFLIYKKSQNLNPYRLNEYDPSFCLWIRCLEGQQKWDHSTFLLRMNLSPHYESWCSPIVSQIHHHPRMNRDSNMSMYPGSLELLCCGHPQSHWTVADLGNHHPLLHSWQGFLFRKDRVSSLLVRLKDHSWSRDW